MASGSTNVGRRFTVPRGAHVLHVGPQKTGSTALQSAFHAARSELRGHGVIYLGPDAKPVRAVQAGLGFGMGRGGVPPRKAAWRNLLAQVDAATPDDRVFISLESFGRMTGERLKSVVEALGGDQPHIVAVARRYDDLLPSQWQQRIKAGKTWSYDEWLRLVLDHSPPSHDAHSVWVPHDTVALVRRWAEVVGMDSVTVVVSDPADRRHLFDAFEDLLDIPRGLLQPAGQASNRSLSYPEVELLRAVNRALGRIRHDDSDWHAMISRGLIPALVRRPCPQGEQPVPPLPRWTGARLASLSDQRIAGLREIGVRVVGDLDNRRVDSPRVPGDDLESPTVISLDLAARAIAGVFRGAARRQTRMKRRDHTDARDVRRP